MAKIENSSGLYVNAAAIKAKMLLNSSRFLFSVEHSRPLLACLVIPLSNNNEPCFRWKSRIQTFITLPQKQIDGVKLNSKTVNCFHTGLTAREKEPKWVFSRTKFQVSDDDYLPIYESEFRKPEKKNKKQFLETVHIFKANVKSKSSPVDFIRTALRHMKEYGVHADLECYKKLIDVLPKGVFICTNVFMAEGMYFPRQQFVVMEALTQMRIHGVHPDVELGEIIRATFGELSLPYTQFSRALYWSIKIKNKSPWLLPEKIPSDAFLLAQLAIKRITSVDIQTEVSVYQTSTVKESLDHTWIVSGQSPKQRKLLAKHAKNVPVIVEGGEVVWLKDKSVNYFVLKADGEPLPYVPPESPDDISNLKSKFFNPNYIIKEDDGPNVHVQDDGTIYGICATGTSSKDSLLSWVRILEREGNPVLADVPVLFRFKQPQKTPAPFTSELTNVSK